MGRLPILRGLAFLALLALPATAQTPLCHDRYAVAQEMLDLAYGRFGTLYSGGPPRSYSEVDLGPTIDLWRLWRGLPDLRFRDARDFDFTGDWGRDFGGFGRNADDLTLILRIAARPQAGGLTDTFRYVTARYLNTLVDAGSGPGWWLAPGPSDQTEGQKRVMAAATPGSLMEWLLVTMALSDTPQAIAWTNQGDWDRAHEIPWDMPAAPDLLDSLIRQRGRDEPGLEWQVAAQMVQGGPSRFAAIVHDCTATQAEYAAHAIAVFHDLQHSQTHPDLTLLSDLPTRLRDLAMANSGHGCRAPPGPGRRQGQSCPAGPDRRPKPVT